MANEHRLEVKKSEPFPFVVADGTAIEKGTALSLTDPRTAIAVSATKARAAGVLARAKVASDGLTEAAVYRDGWFAAKCSGAVILGSKIGFGPDNYIFQVDATWSGASVVGTALETGSDTEEIIYELDIGGGVHA